MRRLAATAGVALLIAAAGCTDDPSRSEEPVDTAANEESSEAEPTGPVELDLAEAGGACPLIDGDLLDEVTGQDFRYASGGPSEESEDEDAPAQLTCAVQTGEAAYPDLTVFVVGSDVSEDVYKDELSDDAESVDDLGKAAYWMVHDEDTGAGPALELGWLGEGNIFEMRYTTPDGTDTAAVEELVGGFTELATSINTAQTEAG